MKKVLGLLALGMVALFCLTPSHPKPDFTNANKIADAIVGDLQAQNTPPIPVPSNLGTWGTAALFTTATSSPIAAVSGIRHYVDRINCFNTSSTANIVFIYDGAAATSLKGYGTCPANSTVGAETIFQPPLQLSAGSTVTLKIGTASGTNYINIHSFESR